MSLGIRNPQLTSGNIKLVVLDFDGTLTDNRVFVDQEGREMVCCNRSDGWGIRLLKNRGIRVVCVTSEQNPVVFERCNKLGIDCIGNVLKKGEVVSKLLSDHGLSPEVCVFLGNSVNDIPALRVVGWPVVVNDAHPKAKGVATLVLASKGGGGAVLELAEKILGEACLGEVGQSG